MTAQSVPPPGTRWVVRLADLTPEQRALVLAALDLRRDRSSTFKPATRKG